MMNRYRYDLEGLGIHYRNYRSNGTRLLEIEYIPAPVAESDESDESVASDTTNPV